MRHLMIYNRVNGSWKMSLLMIMVAVLSTQSHASQPLSRNSILLVAESANPWLIPKPPEETLRFEQPARFRQHPNRSDRYQMNRFVTPEILQSLKQQQMQTQLMQNDRRHNQRYDQQQRQLPYNSSLRQSMPLFPEQNNFASPSYGMGYANPLFDAPAVSPWGNSPDLIYRGESLPGTFTDGATEYMPWTQGDALGGLPPMYVPPGGENSLGDYYGRPGGNAETGGLERGSTENRMENNVFNPFTFLPNQKLQ